MERCKYCGEVLEYGAHFCPVCGKSTEKEPSKSFLKKKAKKDAFKVNYDARLDRLSYRIFAPIFLILSVVLFLFYGHYFLDVIGVDKFATKLAKLGKSIREAVPYSGDGISLLLVFYAGAILFTVVSFFTRRNSLSAIMYKCSALLSASWLLVELLIGGSLSESAVEIICYVVAGITLVTFIIGFVASFNFFNPYRATWYQLFKTLFVCLLVWSAAILKLFGASKVLLDICLIVYYSVPLYFFVASILLFIGAKYRGDIDRLI